jgi:hypothetical protein
MLKGLGRWLLALEAHQCSVIYVLNALMHPFVQFRLLRVPLVVGKKYSHRPSDLSSGGDGDEQNLRQSWQDRESRGRFLNLW